MPAARMQAELWTEIENLFHSARALTPEKRRSFLERACAGDALLESEVQSLLDHLDGAGSFLESSPVGNERADITLPTQAPAAGSVVGNFEIVQLIGHGGMGEVWLAEQKLPVRRRVALKLIKSGLDTREVVARFESERQALALMDHPAIAKIFDGGSTPECRPYFAMEYVPGIPITDYCDKHKLEIEERLELFMRVCEGVQHAHQKAIIHRDLKPSNILITEVDGKPAPKIIDFGVAKATAQRLSAATMLTRVGSVIGTPEYISPEQADSAGENIDTRTDVYSLGVVLYELLVGALPLEFGTLSFAELLHKLRYEDAPRPSTKVRPSSDESSTAARNRRIDPPALTRRLRGDLDAITLKALEKERALRYATPMDLAADVQRHLRHEPVLARPSNGAYRARKYIRRHRLGVSLAAAGVLLLASVAVLEAVQLRRIERESAQRTRITDFMTNMFKVSDPSEGRGNSITAREILDKASKEIGTGLGKDPEVQSQMMYVMGDVYKNLGLYSSAEPLLERSVEIRRRILGPSNVDTLRSMSELGWVLAQEFHCQQAEKLLRGTLGLQRQVLGRENRETAKTMIRLACTIGSENFAEAENLAREATSIQLRTLGSEARDTLYSSEKLGSILLQDGKYDEAEKVLRETLDGERRVYGPQQVETAATTEWLGVTLQREGKYAEAEKFLRAAADSQRRILGPEHPTTLVTIAVLGDVLREEGELAEAEKLLRAASDGKRGALGRAHLITVITLEDLGQIMDVQGRHAEAEKLLRETLDTASRAFGRENWFTLEATVSLSGALRSMGRYAEAEVLLRETLNIRRRVLGPEHADTALTTYLLACTIARQGRRNEAFSILNDAVDHGLPPADDLSIEKDPGLQSLRGDPRFAALVAHAKGKAATARQAK
jgi:eukaryotic-like serine/threonine-protein kinase